ncbi:MAG: hypothetical protein ABIG84_02225 [archaeon]
MVDINIFDIGMPGYLEKGTEQLHKTHTDYKVSFQQIKDANGYPKQRIDISRLYGEITKKILYGEISASKRTPSELESVFRDSNGEVVFSEVNETHTTEAVGFLNHLKWYDAILRNHPYVSGYSEEEAMYLNPTPNEVVIRNVANYGKSPFGEYGIDTVTKKKRTWFGPNKTRISFRGKNQANETVAQIWNRPDHIEITDHTYKLIVPTRELFEGSKWIKDHQKLYSLLVESKLGDVPFPLFLILKSSINTGMEAYLTKGGKTDKLVDSHRDFCNKHQIVMGRATDYISAINDNLKYAVDMEGELINATKFNPIYIKRAIVDNLLGGKPIRFHGKHYGLNTLTPAVKKINIKDLNEDGSLGENKAEFEFYPWISYKDFISTLSLNKPKEYLFDFKDLGSEEGRDKLFTYLDDKGSWLYYLRSREQTKDEWLENANFRLDDKNNRLIVTKDKTRKGSWIDRKIRKKDTITTKDYIGTFEIKDDSLFYCGKKRIPFKVADIEKVKDENKQTYGKKEPEESIKVYTDGKEEVGDIIIERKLEEKSTNLYLLFRKSHFEDGPFLFRGAIAAMANMQGPLRLKTDEWNYRSVYHLPVPLELTFDLLTMILYSGDPAVYGERKVDINKVYGGHKLQPFNGTGKVVDENMTPDTIYFLSQIFKDKVTEEDIAPFVKWLEPDKSDIAPKVAAQAA